MADGSRRWRTGAWVGVVGGVIGMALIAAILHWMPFDPIVFRESLREVDGWLLMGVIGTTIIHCVLTGQKWRLVTRHTDAETDLGAGYYFYSALIALLGQILPLQVAVMTGRSMAMRFHGKMPLRRGAAGAAYDQIFDVLIPAVFLTPAMLYVVGVTDLVWSMMIGGLLIVGVGAGIFQFGERGLGVVFRAIRRVIPPLDRILPVPGGGGYSSGLLMGTLYLYSVVRFANIVLRACLVAWSLGLDINWISMLFSCTVVTFAVLFSFVPGGLGVLEWGWIGGLQAFGVSEAIAVHYALSSRLIIVGSLVTINIVHVFVVGGYWYLRRCSQRKLDT